jgi:hypothetical protein
MLEEGLGFRSTSDAKDAESSSSRAIDGCSIFSSTDTFSRQPNTNFKSIFDAESKFVRVTITFDGSMPSKAQEQQEQRWVRDST